MSIQHPVYVAFGSNISGAFDHFRKEISWLNSWFDPGEHLVIKPNVLMPRENSTGATTNPALVEENIRFLREIGVARITIAESAWVGANTQEAFQHCGYQHLSDQYHVPLVDLKQDEFVEVPVPLSDSILKKIKIARTICDASKIINVPILKAHCQAKLTCGMKNLMGVISDSEKRRFHQTDLARAICELNTVCKPSLQICDAMIGDLTFEEGGTPVKFGRLFLSQDIYSLDCYAANVLGYQPDEIEYLKLYREYHQLAASYELVQLNHPMDQEDFEAIDYRTRFPCGIYPHKACCSCLASVFMALENNAAVREDWQFYIGTNVKPMDIAHQKTLIFVGNCNKKYAHLGHWVAGCPPTSEKLRALLDRLV